MNKLKLSYGRIALLFSATLLMGCAHSIDQSDPRQGMVEHSLLPAIVPAGRPLPSWALKERMARYHVPGVSIALIDRGKIAWAKGYGVTQANGSDAVLPSTLFQAASISKMLTATGALRLVQEGKINLDEDVNKQLVSWKLPFNEYTEQAPVTLRRLLSHTAGVTGHGFSGYSFEEVLPSLHQILEGQPPSNSPPIRVDVVPGRAYRYSGGGYLIVQQLMEDVTGRSFGDLMQQEVMDRVPMTNSTFKQALPPIGREIIASCGHGFDGIPVEHCSNIYPEAAAAGLWSTPTDLARLGIMLSNSFKGRSITLLNQVISELMLTKVTGDMGLGLGIHGEGDRLHFDHAGWNRGFRAYLLVYPLTGKGIVVMVNADGGIELIEEIVRSAAQTYQWPGFEPQRRAIAAIGHVELDSRAGDYEVREYGIVLSVKREDDHLIVSTPRGSSYTFYPATDSDYFAIEDGSELTFVQGHDGAEPALRVWGMVALRRSDQ